MDSGPYRSPTHHRLHFTKENAGEERCRQCGADIPVCRWCLALFTNTLRRIIGLKRGQRLFSGTSCLFPFES